MTADQKHGLPQMLVEYPRSLRSHPRTAASQASYETSSG